MNDSDVGSALEPIQAAIEAKIRSDQTLMLMITGIFDFRGILRGQAYPYISLGDSTETDDSTFDTAGYDTTFTLHIWSNQPNSQECQRIYVRLNKLFNRKPLVLAGMDHVGTWLDFVTTLPDPEDNKLTHMPVRYRIGAGEIGED